MERTRSGAVAVSIDLASEISKNFLMGLKPFREWRLSRPRTTISQGDANEFLQRYAFSALDLLLEHTGSLEGRSVCEIGAGDYLTSGLSILAAGASRYAV